MKHSHLGLLLALATFLCVPHAGAGTPATDEAKQAAAEKSAERKQARAARRAAIADARANGQLSSNEYERNQNDPRPVGGTRASRKEARHEARDLVKEQARAGELPRPNDEWARNQNTPAKVAGTRPERKAERQVIRAELKEANRKGEIPMVTEADLGTGY